MFKTVAFALCLLAVTGQMTWAQGSFPEGPKSVRTATRISIFGTLVPIVAAGALILAPQSDDVAFGEGLAFAGLMVGSLGIVVGPGAGHAYTGRWGHLAKGIAFRPVGALLMASGFLELACGDDCSGMSGWGDEEEEKG